ncbi:BTB/POZ domain-containing protein 7 [Copidosoma floridanum]|uniref:BTB/POZ domain-containing protein 7 n=1 Tax=Copidosoma floridanum TaxID=29053 RepID=UPI0006C9C092|nr:BTB/POZ domain-containing protein 7 [Copidosoma floridanum]XP_014203805.1 BTB/POZ domain-containing protein 7 [Copidosoma floridanum]
MNIFRALIPCALHRSGESGAGGEEESNSGGCWFTGRGQGNNSRMTQRMGSASSSLAPIGGDSVQAARLSGSANSDPLSFIVRERKKRVTGFATLRKKFIRRRRSSKACDHGRIIRELVSGWSPLEAGALLEEYEALAALKDLHVQAELARPPAATYKQDLASLYEYKYCTDVDLIFRGTCFPAHRALLSVRCAYLRDLLAAYPGYGAQVALDLSHHNIDVPTLIGLLRYFYSGDCRPSHEQPGGPDAAVLRFLADEFGSPNPLEQDLRYLLETGTYADAALVFTSDSDYHRPDSGSSEYGFRPKLELPCHKAILSARSPFFRNLIQRRTRSGEDQTERALHIPTRIVLDESVIPKRFAHVLLHAVYLDVVDLSLILRSTGCTNSAGSLGEVQALTHTGRARPSPLEEAMELYQIGRFLELDILSQGCEDLILEWLTLDSLPNVLRWGSQPHGSAWVHRQALHFLREEFQPVATSPILNQLDLAHLSDVLQSHFLQASELEVLQAVLKWGEQELVRRMEDREPNLLSHTVHSVAKKGVKKRDLSDIELREILSELLPLVRMDHVLPPNNEALAQAIRRGLVSVPPSHMIGDERENLRINAWIRGGKKNGLFVRPRLFMPYYEEVKALVEEQMVQESELVRLRRARYIPDIPDTLYMVDEKPRIMGAAGVDVLAAALPVPDSATMAAMLKREQKLRQSPSCQRAISLPLSSRHEINRQLRLRVVREFNLPDAVADLLENAACYGSSLGEPDSHSVRSDEDCGSLLSFGGSGLGGGNGPGGAVLCYGRNMTFPRHAASYGHRHHELPAIVTEGENYRLAIEHSELNSCSEGHLSGIMPDVAMATASFGALQLVEQQELELDLGDGASHLLQQQQQQQQHQLRQQQQASSSLGLGGHLHRGLQAHRRQSHFGGLPPAPYMYHRSAGGLPRFI